MANTPSGGSLSVETLDRVDSQEPDNWFSVFLWAHLYPEEALGLSSNPRREGSMVSDEARREAVSRVIRVLEDVSESLAALNLKVDDLIDARGCGSCSTGSVSPLAPGLKPEYGGSEKAEYEGVDAVKVDVSEPEQVERQERGPHRGVEYLSGQEKSS